MGQLIKMAVKGLAGAAIATVGVVVYKAYKEVDKEDDMITSFSKREQKATKDLLKNFKPGTFGKEGFTGFNGGGSFGQFGGMGQPQDGFGGTCQPGGYKAGQFNGSYGPTEQPNGGAGQLNGSYGATPKGGFGFNKGQGQFGGYTNPFKGFGSDNQDQLHSVDGTEFVRSSSLEEAKSRIMGYLCTDPKVVDHMLEVVNTWSKRGVPEKYSIDFLDSYMMVLNSVESFLGEYDATDDKEGLFEATMDRLSKAKDKITSPLTADDLEKLSNKTGGIITDCEGKPKVDWDKAERASLEKVSEAVGKFNDLLNKKLGK